MSYTAEGAEAATPIEAVEGVYSFEMPAANVTVTAEFEAAAIVATVKGTVTLPTDAPDDASTNGVKVTLTEKLADDSTETAKPYPGTVKNDEFTISDVPAGTYTVTVELSSSLTGKFLAPEEIADVTVDSAEVTVPEIALTTLVTYELKWTADADNYTVTAEYTAKGATDKTTVASGDKIPADTEVSITVTPAKDKEIGTITYGTDGKIEVTKGTEAVTGTVKMTADTELAITMVNNGPYNFKLSYADTDASTYAKVTSVQSGKTAAALGNVTYSTNVTAKSVLTKDNILQFKVVTLNGFTNTVTVTMGDEVQTLTPTADTTDSALQVYKIDKVTGDVVIEVGTTKATAGTLTLSGTKVGAKANNTSIKLYVDGSGDYAETYTIPNSVAAAGPITVSVPAGAKVAITNATAYSNAGDYNLSDDVVGTVKSNVLSFTMPSGNLSITDDLFEDSNKSVIAYVDSSLKVTASTNATEVTGGYQATDTTKPMTLTISSPTGAYIIVDNEETLFASSGSVKTMTGTTAVASGNITGSVYIKPATVLTLTDVTATTAAKDDIADGDGVVPGTSLTIAPATSKGSAVIAIPTATLGALTAYASDKNVAGTWKVPEAATTLQAAVKVTLNGATATVNGVDVAANPYVTASADSEVPASGTAATANKLSITVTEGTYVIKEFSAGAGYNTATYTGTTGTSDLTLYSAVKITSTNSIVLMTTPATGSETTLGAELYVLPSKTVYVIPSAVTKALAVEETKTPANTVTLTDKVTVGSTWYQTFTTGTADLTISETAAQTTKDIIVNVYEGGKSLGTAYLDSTDSSTWSATATALVTAITGSNDKISFTDTSLGKWVYVDDADDPTAIATVLTNMAALAAETTIKIDVGYYKVTAAADTTVTGAANAAVTYSVAGKAVAAEGSVYAVKGDTAVVTVTIGDKGIKVADNAAASLALAGSVAAIKENTVEGTAVSSVAVNGSDATKIDFGSTKDETITKGTFTFTLTVAADDIAASAFKAPSATKLANITE